MRRTALLSLAGATALSLATAAAAQTYGRHYDRGPVNPPRYEQGRFDRASVDFLKAAVQGDRDEIMLARVAMNRAASPRVRQYAAMLMQDHRDALQQAVSVAQSVGIDAPHGPSAKAQLERAKLDVLTGRNFDREFIRYMIRDHQKDIADFRVQAMSRGPASRMASQAIPTLRRHLDAALNIMRG